MYSRHYLKWPEKGKYPSSSEYGQMVKSPWLTSAVLDVLRVHEVDESYHEDRYLRFRSGRHTVRRAIPGHVESEHTPSIALPDIPTLEDAL